MSSNNMDYMKTFILFFFILKGEFAFSLPESTDTGQITKVNHENKTSDTKPSETFFSHISGTIFPHIKVLQDQDPSRKTIVVNTLNKAPGTEHCSTTTETNFNFSFSEDPDTCKV